MILDSLGGSSRKEKELEEQCDKLVESVKKKETELENKERQIQHLSKNIRKWTRKYHELELSVSNSVIEIFEPDEPEHIQEIKHLQKMLLKLSRKNEKLEKRLDKMSGLIVTDSSAKNEKNDRSTSAQFSSVVEEDPEFSPEFKSVLEKHAEACSH